LYFFFFKILFIYSTEIETTRNSAPQDSANPLTVNGILGESVTLSLKLPARDDIQSITWLHNGKSVTFILPKAAPDVRVSVTDTERKHRLQIMENYSLLLSNLTAADTGLYCAQITMQTSTEFSCYTLQVFRQLRNLRITNHTRLSDIGTCEIHLTCSVENSNDSLLRWHVVGNTSIKEANLTISWDPRNSSDQKYTCIAENPVSNIAFSVSTQSLCKGNSLSQVPLRALSSCGLWCVPPAQGDSPKQWPSGRNLDYVSVSPGNTVYACVTHPNKVSPFSFILHHWHGFYSLYSQTCHHNHLTNPMTHAVEERGGSGRSYDLVCGL
uniref:Ig-like domain-containing protein n=1 Tax=Ursus americanus TaxID=9643 RepID=A0A452R486_URSAM